ncbi:MAG: peptide MFS transporter [Alphaproteobacteria bacterium]
MDIVFLAGIVVTVVTIVPVVVQVRRHPRGLFILFFAEMWERFSYYGMRGLLIFYLTQQFLFTDDFANGEYGAYTSLVYLLPLIGGFVADKWLGTRKAIAFGALLLVAGHFTMAIEGRPATQVLRYGGHSFGFVVTGRGEAREARLKIGDATYEVGAAPGGGMAIKGLPHDVPLPGVLARGTYELSVVDRDPLFTNIMYLALSLIIMGVGFLKANISSIVGQLYSPGDARRDPGFTLYYYGINLGAFWAAIACGWLGTNIGWWAGFGAAGVGMALGYVAFVFGKPLLEGHGEPPEPARLKKPALGPINFEWAIYLAAFGGLALVWALVQHNEVVGYLLAAGSALVLGYLFWFMAAKCTKVERERMLLALILIAASVVFWTLFEQAGTSLNLFTERNSSLRLFGVPVAAPQVQSFNAGFILIFAPVFSALWAYLGHRRSDPDPIVKFGLGLLQVGASFFVLVWSARFADAHFRVPLYFLALSYLLQTTGELCLSPVGLSQMTKLSPVATISTIMATWFLASSWAQWIGGKVAQLTSAETVAGQVLDPHKALTTYVSVFEMIGYWGAGAGVLMLLMSPVLKHWAHAREEK